MPRATLVAIDRNGWSRCVGISGRDRRNAHEWLRKALFASTKRMSADLKSALPAELAMEFEERFFWWQPIGLRPRSRVRVFAQAMDLASFEDIRRLESVIGTDRLADIMLSAEPGWFSDRSWEFWRGRLTRATGRAIPEEPPRRLFNAQMA